MKHLIKSTLIVASIPLAAGAYITFHPGVAWAQDPEPASVSLAKFQLPGTFKIDPMHTSVGFDIGHFGLSRVQGRFNEMSGSITIDPQNLEKNAVEVVIKTQSVDTAVTPRDNHLRTADFFDAAKFPEIRFKSTSVTPKGTGYVLEGNLTIKDVTKKVSIPFKHFGPLPEQDGGLRVGFVSEPLTINRLDYGVGADQKLPNGASAISNDVVIRLSVEAIQPKK